MPEQSASVLVTGASGTVGRKLASLLGERGVQVIAANRSGGAPAGAKERGFDWYAPETHTLALEGVRRMYLIPPVPSATPETVMIPFLERARAAGVERVILQSNSPTGGGGRGTGQVHQAIGESFKEWAVLRPSWFMQNVNGKHPLAQMLRRTLTLVTATGNARVAFVDAEDVARTAAALLTSQEAINTDVILTGPEALSFEDVARILSEAGGKAIRQDNIDAGLLPARYEAIGLPEQAAKFLAMMDSYLATGAEDRTTSNVERITGAAPRSYRDFALAEFRL